MTLTFGTQKVEIRPWGGENSGKVLLMTRDDLVKRQLIAAMEDDPDMVAPLTEPDVVACDEDTEGLMLAIVDRKNVAMFFDLDKLAFGICLYKEENGYE